MTNTTTDQPTKEFTELPIDLIDPDPQNRKVVADKDFVASVVQHGVVEPILVVPHAETNGRYLIVASGRRWREAKTKLDAIPAVVRHDLDEAARIELQVIENLQRQDLKPCEEARQLKRLSEVGHNVKTLSTNIGRGQKYVRDRLRLVELPRKAQALIDSGDWTIEAGLVALKLRDHPNELEAIIESWPYNLVNAVEGRLREMAFETAALKLATQAEAKGITLVKAGTKHERLSSLGIDATDHQGEDCHGVILTGNPSFRRKPTLEPVCTSPARHRAKGASAVKVAHSAGDL